MSSLTLPTEGLYSEFNNQVDVVASGAGLYVRSGDFAVVSGTTNLASTRIDTTNNPFNVVGSNQVNFNVTSGILMSSTAASQFTTTTGLLTLSSTDTTSAGGVLIQAAGQHTNGAIYLNATNSTSGIIKLSAAANSANAVQIGATGTSSAILMSATGVISIDTTDTTNGTKIGTVTSGAPITLGTSAATVSVPGNLTITGNLTVSGTQTILNSTVVNIEDNLLMLSAGQSTLGLDSGIMIDRYQVPNAGGTGDLVAGSGSLIQESGTTTGVGSTSTVVFAANASSTDDYYKDWWIMITSGSAANQVRKITSYVGSTKTATIYTTGTDGAAFTVTPGNGVTYNLYNAGNATMMYSSSTGQFNFLTNATSSDNGVLTTVTTSQQYTPLNSQAVTVKPLVFNNVSASVSSTTLTLSVAGNTPTVGDKIALSNLSGFTGTSVPTTVAYSVVSVSAPTFTITVPSGAITTNASVTVSFLESSVVYANKISLADSRYGQLSLGGVSFYTELVTIPASNTLGVLITNSRTYGLYQIFASDDNNTTGAKAVWTIAGTGSGGGATQMSSVQGTGTSTPSLKLIWSSATQIYLAHRSAASVNYTYKVVMLVF